MRFKRLSDWLEWQETLHPIAVDLGLERCRAVIQTLGWETFPLIVSVAGTNGKGSCVAMLDAILTAAGWQVGTYTSPHLVRYNERVTVGGRPVDDDELMAAFHRLDRARGDETLTYFEFGTLGAMEVFRRRGVEVALLEVGIGGRLDAVNSLDADIALVTTVDIDHVGWLGSDRDAIGREKAGIFRAGRPAVLGDRDPPGSLVSHARSMETPLYRRGEEFDLSAANGTWAWRCGAFTLRDLPRPALVGSFQLDNAAAVLAVLWLCRERVPVPEAAIRAGLAEVRLRGRFQLIPGPVERIIDVAHNAQATTALAENLRRRPCAGRTLALVGMLADKDRRAALEPLRSVIDAWHVTDLDTPRSARAEEVAATLKEMGVSGRVTVHHAVTQGYRIALEAAEAGDRLVVFGSFYAAGEILALLDDPL